VVSVRTILYPADFSDQSQTAFDVACALAQANGARLVVLHVNDSAIALSTDEAEVRQLKQNLNERLRSFRPADTSIAVDHRLVEGNPPLVILDVAEELSADLIVMGTHGHTGLVRALMGSVAEEVVRRANCPVVTVRSPPARRPERRRVVVAAAVPVM
jgi:nucleotide-binding universal stress UspA family protein